MARLSVWLSLALTLTACGAPERPTAPAALSGSAPWRHCTVEGLSAGSGLTVFDGDLLAVAGGNDREVYVVPRADLESGGSVRARTLAVDISPDRPLMGAEAFATQGYEMKHLWALPVDFQGAAVQAPDMLYLGDRIRRVVYWGRLGRDAQGRLARLKLAGLTVAPGAQRTKVDEGDWRDQGPGLAGLLALEGRQRMEDLYVLDAAPGEGGVLRIHRMDRYGSPLGSIPVQQDAGAAPACRAIAWDGQRYLVHHGDGRGRTWAFAEPESAGAVRAAEGTPGPDVEGVHAWTGMARASDGTLYMLSDGSPAVVAWRAP